MPSPLEILSLSRVRSPSGRGTSPVQTTTARGVRDGADLAEITDPLNLPGWPGRDAGDRAPRTGPPRRPTARLRGTRRLPLPA